MSLTSYRAAPPRDVPHRSNIESIPRRGKGVKRILGSESGPRDPWVPGNQEAPRQLSAATDADPRPGDDGRRRSGAGKDHQVAAREVHAILRAIDGEGLG